MQHDLEQEVRAQQRRFHRSMISNLVFVAHRAGGDADGSVVQRSNERIDLGAQAGLGKLLWKTPQLAPAGDGRMIVKKHAMGIAAAAALKGNRDDLPALGVV